jgi:Protein of unknown function (DUF3156)
VIGRPRARARATLEDVLAAFAGLGLHVGERRGELEAVLDGPADRPPLRVRLVPEGRILGGAYGLEVSPAAPVLPPSGGLSASGRGVVRLQGVRFRARRGDAAGAALAARLGADEALARTLSRVHFERIRVTSDGTPVIRHLGGSLVWVAVPPAVRATPLVEEQARAVVAALAAFARCGD